MKHKSSYKFLLPEATVWTSPIAAYTKPEARSMLKNGMGIKRTGRLPLGTVSVRAGQVFAGLRQPPKPTPKPQQVRHQRPKVFSWLAYVFRGFRKGKA